VSIEQWTHRMTQTDSDLHLEVTSVGGDGKRRYSRQAKRRLVEACLQPGVSVAGLALKAGVNANLLRRWIKLYQQRRAEAATQTGEHAPFAPVPTSAFVHVIESARSEVVGASTRQSRLVQPRVGPVHETPRADTVAIDGANAQRRHTRA